MEEDYNSDDGVVWNFDDEEAKLIFEMKLEFIRHRKVWNLEQCFWALYNLWTETEALFDESKRKELIKTINKIVEVRNDTDNFANINDILKGQCFDILNDFYRLICIEVVDKGLYFKKKKKYLGL